MKIDKEILNNAGELLSSEEMVHRYYDIAVKHTKSIWYRLPKHTMSYEDVLQYGLIGLLEASKSYDQLKKVPFEAYAAYRIRGSILNSLRYQSEYSARYYYMSDNNSDDYLNTLGSEEGVQEVFDIVIFYYLKYFLNADHDQVYAASLMNEDDICLFDKLMDGVENLGKQHKKVIYDYYLYQLSMSEIAATLECSKTRVSQIHAQALEVLKVAIVEAGPNIILKI
jgi:RNA polymerase sigma factor for flagellar operon FliA